VERTENIHNGKKYLSAKFAAEKGEDFLKSQTEQIALELKEYGFNLNFSPCLDVNTNPNNPIIGERAFSNATDEVIKYGKIVTETYIENGIIPCAKHFPGHGDAAVDSHIALPKIDLSLEEMEKFHIKPFKELIDIPMIMVAHMHCTAFDQEEIPSSLSENVVKKYLIETLGYKGLIITDDMVMGGVLGLDGTEACKRAIKAGVDILLYRGSDDETIEIIENLAKMAETDEVLRANIETSYNKIITFKKSYFA
jgi:beta-N-acetylhexosaminidase